MSEQEQEHDPFQLCGTTIEGKYLITKVVGDGGFGVVYRAEHQGFHEPVAVKCLKLPGRMSTREREMLLSQLREEGRLLLRLSKASSSIVQALDIGAFTKPDGPWVPYLVLEWLEGETLAHFLKKRAERGEGPMSIADTVKLLDPAALALATAHEQKVAHRDVKPQNLFLAQVGTARTMKVLDFGIAKVLASHPTLTQMMAETNMGPTAFTPRYGAPEQFNKKRGATGPWTDVFALALIVVELSSGRMALDGDDPTELYISAADPATRPTLRSRGVPTSDGIEQVLEKALNVEPKHRYANLGEFWDALKAAVQEAGPIAHKAAPARPAALEMTSEDGQLGTAEFASAHNLDVSAKDRPGVPSTLPMTVQATAETAPKLEPTLPGSPADGGLATTAEGKPPAAALEPAVVEAPSPAKTTAKTIDPMAETPLAERAPHREDPKAAETKAVEAAPAAPQEKPAEKTAEKPQEKPKEKQPSKPAAEPEKAPAPAIFAGGESQKPSRTGLWIGLGIVALTLGGGAFAVLSGSGGDSGPSPKTPKGSASAQSSAKVPSSKPSASSAPAAATPATSASANTPAAIPAAPDDMVYIAPGTAKLGMGETEREVTITRGFFIDRNEVTVHAYQACLARRKCSAANALIISAEQEDAGLDGVSSSKEFVDAWGRYCNEPRKAFDHPINCVDYSNAENYCRYKGRRLPTEAEWELAARGTAGRVYAWGETEAPCMDVCFDRNGLCANPAQGVGSCASGGHPKDVTPEGVLDMGGNVSEWVSDGYVAKPQGGSDPMGDSNVRARTAKGGSFFDDKTQLIAARRFAVLPGTAHVAIGFRCAMDIPQEAPAASGAPSAPGVKAAPAKGSAAPKR